MQFFFFIMLYNCLIITERDRIKGPREPLILNYPNLLQEGHKCCWVLVLTGLPFFPQCFLPMEGSTPEHPPCVLSAALTE